MSPVLLCKGCVSDKLTALSEGVVRSGVLESLLPLKQNAYASCHCVLMWIFCCRRRDQLSSEAFLGTLASEDFVVAGALRG